MGTIKDKVKEGVTPTTPRNLTSRMALQSLTAWGVDSKKAKPNYDKRMSLVRRVEGGAIFNLLSADNVKLEWGMVQALEDQFGPDSGGLFSKQSGKFDKNSNAGKSQWGVSAGSMIRVIVRRLDIFGQSGVVHITLLPLHRPGVKILDLDCTLPELEDLLGGHFTSFIVRKTNEQLKMMTSKQVERYVEKIDRTKQSRPQKINDEKQAAGYGGW